VAVGAQRPSDVPDDGDGAVRGPTSKPDAVAAMTYTEAATAVLQVAKRPPSEAVAEDEYRLALRIVTETESEPEATESRKAELQAIYAAGVNVVARYKAQPQKARAKTDSSSRGITRKPGRPATLSRALMGVALLHALRRRGATYRDALKIAAELVPADPRAIERYEQGQRGGTKFDPIDVGDEHEHEDNMARWLIAKRVNAVIERAEKVQSSVFVPSALIAKCTNTGTYPLAERMKAVVNLSRLVKLPFPKELLDLPDWYLP
jgi:hypothetical protein